MPLTSTRLPADTKVDRPSPRRTALSSRATPSAPDWEKKPSRPRSGTSGDSDAFNDTAGSVLITPKDAGPITRMPLPRASAHQPALPLGAFRPGLGEAAGHHDEPAHTLGGAVGDDRLHLLGGYRDHGEVDGPGHVAHGRERRDAGDLVGMVVDDVHRAGEPAVEDVPKQDVPE